MNGRREHLLPLMADVAEWAWAHRAAYDKVVLAFAGGVYRFWFVLPGPFDWDRSDDMGELQGALLAAHEDGPRFSCAVMPCACMGDMGVEPLAELDLDPARTKGGTAEWAWSDPE